MAPQALPQAPQLALSRLVSTQRAVAFGLADGAAGLAGGGPGSAAAEAAAVRADVAAGAAVVGVAAVGVVQTPSQSACMPWQPQTPLSQDRPPVQTMPQPPQLFWSKRGSVQPLAAGLAPPAADDAGAAGEAAGAGDAGPRTQAWLAPQARPQPPQFSWSLSSVDAAAAAVGAGRGRWAESGAVTGSRGAGFGLGDAAVPGAQARPVGRVHRGCRGIG